jgi:hypothetical protein
MCAGKAVESKTNSVACIRFDLYQWLLDGTECCGARKSATSLGECFATRSHCACGTLSEQTAQAQQGASRALRLPKITMDAGYLRLQSNRRIFLCQQFQL